MPELPDVEQFKRHLDATCRGHTIRQAVVGDERILRGIAAEELRARLRNARIVSTRRHGKHLLVSLAGAGWLALHFGMNGSLRHFRDGEDDPPYDRLRLDFAEHDHLAYINPRLLGGVGLAADADAFVAAEGLGPDALDPRVDLAFFERLIANRRRDVKAVLMDQTLLAGIGNIFSDEILFQARIHPRARADRLDGETRKRLFRAMKDVLETAIDCGAGAERTADRLPRSFLLPQRKPGGRCPNCGGEIRSIKIAGRTAWYCPACQPEPG